MFRASGRLIWPLYYLLMIGALAWFFREFGSSSRTTVTALAIVGLTLQWLDNGKLYERIQKVDGSYFSPSSFASPLWSNLKGKFKRIDLIPPSISTPCPPYTQAGSYYGNPDYYIAFAFLAVEQGLGINSGERARPQAVGLAEACSKEVSRFIDGAVDPDVLFVVDRVFYERHKPKVSNSFECHVVDGLIVCVKKPTTVQLTQLFR